MKKAKAKNKEQNMKKWVNKTWKKSKQAITAVQTKVIIKKQTAKNKEQTNKQTKALQINTLLSGFPVYPSTYTLARALQANALLF